MSTPGIRSTPQVEPADLNRRPITAAGPSWRVIHACEGVRDVLSVAESQVSVGMRPYIVTPQGAGAAEQYLSGKEAAQPAPLSMLRCWQDVRAWRKSILDCDPAHSADVVHAHSFASGMAAVRGCDAVVYDFHDCIEEMAINEGQIEPASWMGRSFRAAEQFILSRAAAVIVHSLGMQQAAQERGALAGNIFRIPDPLGPDELMAVPSLRTSQEVSPFQFPSEATVFFAPGLTAAREKLPASAMFILDSFAQAAHELPDCRLLLEVPEGTASALQLQAKQMGLFSKVIFTDAANNTDAWLSAQVVIASADANGGNANERRTNPVCLRALRQGTTLLAADVVRNRDASPEGRGCLWFDPHNARDLGCRLAFLGNNPDFRIALAATGRAHLLETRSHAAIGTKYSEAYRHAVGRKKSKGNGSGLAAFYPATNCA